MNQICDKCKYVSGFSSEFPCNRCVVIAINCFVPNNAALNSEELAATVPPVGAANNRSDEIALMERIGAIALLYDDPYNAVGEIRALINDRIAQLRAVR